jgi:hypothetical protein
MAGEELPAGETEGINAYRRRLPIAESTQGRHPQGQRNGAGSR